MRTGKIGFVHSSGHKFNLSMSNTGDQTNILALLLTAVKLDSAIITDFSFVSSPL